MTNDVVCSHEVHHKSKLMFELYVLHLPNMCRHRQIKHSAFGLASSLIMLPLALCLYLPDPKGRDLHYLWKAVLLTGKGEALGLEEYPTPIQNSLWDQHHLWLPYIAAKPFPPIWSPANPGAAMHPWGIPPYTEHAGRIYRPYKRDEIHVLVLRAYRFHWLDCIFKKYFCLQHSTTAWYWYFITPKYQCWKNFTLGLITIIFLW